MILALFMGVASATGLGGPDLGTPEPAVLRSKVDLKSAFEDAAREHDVPEVILLALAHEASRWRSDLASQWGGYGLFDLREVGEGGPSVERAAVLAGLDPDDVIARPEANIQAAAALLAWQARAAGDGHLPATDDLEAWYSAVRAFSGRHEPNLQHMFASYIFELIQAGVPLDPATGLEILPRPVDVGDQVVVPPPSSCDYSGCAQFVSASSSNYSNYSRTASDISYVIVHTVQGSYSGCISWFQNSSASVSAHYVVRSSDGQVTQMVHEEDVGWHAGNWSYNLASVGIEHEGYVSDPSTWYTDAMYQGSANLTADIISRNGISASRSYIIGHNEVPGATHTDPGSGWDWDKYMDLVGGGGSTEPSTGDLIGVVADTDIYNGDRLPGATVWLAETGEQTTVDSDGYYTFTDLALDSYTVHACMQGYSEATCSKSISTGDNWCSIALEPGDGDCSLEGWDNGEDEDSGEVDTAVDTDEPADTADTDDTDRPGDDDFDTRDFPSAGGQPPGSATPLEETQRGCAAAPVGALLWWWVPAFLVRRRF